VRLTGKYSLVEKQQLTSSLPPNVTLQYDYKACTYVFMVHNSSGDVEIHRVSRGVAVRYRDARRVFNYLARRALMKHGYKSQMRINSRD
jgi:hypothetical protein